MTGICGDNCEYCPRYIATRNGGNIDLEKVKELWVRLGLRDRTFPVEDMACHGCSPENKCAYTELRTCAAAKDLETCGQCGDYPCDLIEFTFEKSEKLRMVAAAVCSREEMEMLTMAFFAKKDNLDRMHREHPREK